MKKLSKGFTLIELLLVVTLIGIITSVFTYFSRSAVVTAKAVTIVKNMELMKTAAIEYYVENIRNNPTVANNGTGFRQIEKQYLGLLAEQADKNDKNSEKGLIHDNATYILMPGSDSADDEEWFVKCDFKNDSDRDALIAKLVELAPQAQLLNDRNDTVRTYEYTEDGVKKFYEWHGREIFIGSNYSRGKNKYNYYNTEYKYVVYMRVK